MMISRIMAIFLVGLCAYSSSILAQDVYEQVDSNGNITFTDNPSSQNAVKVALPSENSSPGSAAKPNPAQAGASNSAPTASAPSDANSKPYKSFEIISPTDQASIQNQPKLNIDIKLDPALRSGDRVQIYLDGKEWGKALPSIHFEFTIPDRGQHSLSAAVFDANLKLLEQTNTITIYVHQAHI